MRARLFMKSAMALVASFGLVATFAASAQAAPGDYGQLFYDNDTANLTIARSQFVEESNVNLRLYYPSNPSSGVVYRVYDYNLCVNVGRNDTVRSPRNFDIGDRVTRYEIMRVTQDSQGRVTNEQVMHTFYGNYYTNLSSPQCGASSIYQASINQNWMTQDVGTGLYFVKLRVTVARLGNGSLANNFTNKFRVGIPATGGVVAPEGEASSGNIIGSAVMIERPDQRAIGTGSGRNRAENFRNYIMRFGSSCEVPAGGSAVSIRFYDLDNVRDGVSSPNALNAQEFRSIEIRLLNSTTGGLVDLWAGTGTRSADRKTVYPPQGTEYDNRPYEISYRAMPGQKYELQINDVYIFNTVQFTLPFDGIYWNVPCEGLGDTTVTPSIDLTSDAAGNNSIGGAVEEGDPINVQTSFANLGDRSASISYTRQVWWDVDGNDTYNIAPGGPDIWINSATNQPVNLDSGSTTRLPEIQRAASLDNGRRRLCVRLFTNSSNDQTVVLPENRNLVRCVLIGKTPTFQAWGSDVRVGGSAGLTARFGINSNLKNSSGASPRSFGSWGEYGVFSSGLITGFGSGATLKTGLPGAATPPASAINKLTFANTPASGGYSNSAGIGLLPREAIKAHPAFNTNLVNTMPSGTINNTRIYRSNSNVTINSDIIYGNTAGSPRNIPQVVIIAPNISIAGDVRRVDAWLIADNTIDTCAGTDNMTAARCNQPLSINGPVMAATLKLKRTYTVASNKAVPAETINLRSDAYIWAYERYGSSDAGSMRTSYISELPPRY